MWHSQFISRGASYSWWGLTLGDFKGAQTWKFLPYQEEKIKRKYFHSFYIVDGHPGLSHGWRERFHTREKRLWENCWKGCSGIWLEEKAQRGHSNPSSRPQLCMWPWASHVAWLGLNFPICDRGFIRGGGSWRPIQTWVGILVLPLANCKTFFLNYLHLWFFIH